MKTGPYALSMGKQSDRLPSEWASGMANQSRHGMTGLKSSTHSFRETAEEAAQKQRVREFFNRDKRWKGLIYRKSDDRFESVITRRKEYVFHLLDRLPESSRGTALDVGCGGGEYLAGLLHRGWNPTGIDLAPEMVKSCAERFNKGEVSLHSGDVESLPYASNTFDLVLCVGVLAYLPSDEHALNEIRRVLKPGGYAIINLENMMSISNVDYVLRRSLISLLRRPWKTQKSLPISETSMISPWVTSHSATRYQYRLHNPWKFEALMRTLGFSRVDAITFGYEFRWIRKLKIAPELWLINIERFLELIFRRIKAFYFRYSGEAYAGVFKKVYGATIALMFG